MRKFVTIMAVVSIFSTCKKTTFTLDGSRSHGYTNYLWKQVSGKQSKIINPDSLVTKVEVGDTGIYVFRLGGGSQGDSVKITVIP